MRFGVAKHLVNNTAPFYPRNDMLNQDTNTGNPLVFSFLFGGQFLTSWFLLWLIGTDMVRFKTLETRIFKEHTAWGKCVVFFITNAFVMDTPSLCPTEVAHETLFNVNDEGVFHRMRFFYHYTLSWCTV
jgi:hypothetical protein